MYYETKKHRKIFHKKHNIIGQLGISIGYRNVNVV